MSYPTMLRGGIGKDVPTPLFPKTEQQLRKERRREREDLKQQIDFEVRAELAIMKEKARLLMQTLETIPDNDERRLHEDPQWPRYVLND